MTKSKLILALGAMLCLAVTPSAFAANTAKVETTGSSTIKGLNIAAKTGKVESFADDSGYHAEAYIAGTYTAPSAQWVLSAGDQSVTWRGTKGTGGFYYKAPLTGKTTVIDFTAVTPSGDLQHQSVQITFDDYDTAKEEALAHPADSGKFLVGAQVQSISYQDARSPNISEVAINITADYHRSIINPDWFVDAFGSASALPLGSGGNDLRFYKVDLQIGHDFNLSDSTQLGLSVGGSYEAMTESTANLGFSPLFGPEVVLLAKMRAFAIHLGGGTYSGHSPGTFGDHRITAGISYTLPGDAKHPITVNLDGETLHLNLENGDVPPLVPITMAAGAIGVSYGL